MALPYFQCLPCSFIHLLYFGRLFFYFFPTLFGFYIFDELFSRIIATLLYQFNDFYSDSTSSISLFGFRRFAKLSLISLFYQTISSFFYLFLLLPFIIRKKCRIWRKFNFINRLWLQRLWIFFCHLTMIILHKLDADRCWRRNWKYRAEFNSRSILFCSLCANILSKEMNPCSYCYV